MESAEQYRVNIKDLAEDSIEKCWIPLWSKVRFDSIPKDLVRPFLSIGLMNESDALNVIEELITKNDFSAQLIHKSMLTRFNIKMSPKCQLWLILIFESPGDSVMKFAYIKWKMHQLNLTSMDFNDLNMKIFPHGYPSKDDMQWLWDCQKIKTDSWEDTQLPEYPGTGNLLDCGIAYKSFL